MLFLAANEIKHLLRLAILSKYHHCAWLDSVTLLMCFIVLLRDVIAAVQDAFERMSFKGVHISFTLGTMCVCVLFLASSQLHILYQI